MITTIILIFCCSIQSGCKEPEPIRIGFLGDLTARAAGLSTSGRDGFSLAIEEVNARGGIKNRRVEGLIRDTRMDNETALEAVRELAKSDVSAIIEPMTSQTAVAIVPEINRIGIPTISPTVSTNELAGLDDYFFRVYYTNAQAAQLLASELTARGNSRELQRSMTLKTVLTRKTGSDTSRRLWSKTETRRSPGSLLISVQTPNFSISLRKPQE